MTRSHRLIGAADTPADGPSRRDSLRLLAAGAALALAGCTRPREEIFPYVEEPEGAPHPGVLKRYATALPLAGYGRGMLALVRDGRPIKIEGNPRHPASLGATDVFAEAGVLDLFDPQRAKTAGGPAGPSAWSLFAATLHQRLQDEGPRRGAGLRLLTGRITSPTVLSQVAALRAAYPAMRHVRWEPVHDDAEMAGAVLAYGRRLTLRPRLAEARVVLCLDADPLGPGPDQIAHGRGFAAGRRPEAGPVSRWTVLEPALTLTGACADARVAASPTVVGDAAVVLARVFGAEAPDRPLPESVRRLVTAAARDLMAAPGQALVLAGRAQPPEVHALAAWINARLAAPVDAIEPVDPIAEPHGAGLAGLIDEMRAGQVSTLLILDANPVHDAPGALDFARALQRVGFSAHLGLYRDETAAACTWTAPLSHPLESWSDLRGPDGTASLVQPLVRTLYDTRTPAEALALALRPTPANARDLVRETWRPAADGDAEGWWRRALVAGVVPDSAAARLALPQPRLHLPAPRSAPLSLRLVPSANVWDGRFGPNAWLQECPEPLTKEVWGASLSLSPADARAIGVEAGDTVRLAHGGREVLAAARIDAAQAAGVATLPLGYGRGPEAGIAAELGPDAARLRPADGGWTLEGVALARGEGARAPPATPSHVARQPETEALFPVLAPGGSLPRHPPPASSLRPAPRGEHAWAMVIDTSVCIGCNACVVACQSENNVPVIGAEEIARNRDMHWLRIDRYDTGEAADPRPGFQPVPCMQCEQAPCEPVCPVEASVHDSEGLNAQVYNRCIGTRFCEANCPYKVRRFNFLDYADGRVWGDLDARSVTAQRNPEVTVRARGVMEKCTYCVQRISAARREAEKAGQPIADGTLQTACAVACPTEAIVFGDLADPDARVGALKQSPRHYTLLEELGTRPRTTYLAKVRDPAAGEGA